MHVQAVGFLLYGILLFFDVERVIQSLRNQVKETSSDENDEMGPEELSRNPMKKVGSAPGSDMYHTTALTHQQILCESQIAIVAMICLLCFFVRTALLPIMNNAFDTLWPFALIYFILSEIFPLVLMLNIFDTKAASGTHTAHTLRPLLGPT